MRCRLVARMSFVGLSLLTATWAVGQSTQPAVSPVVPPAVAQPAELPSAMPAVLGERFTGMFDVSFRPFAGGKQLDSNDANEKARFFREDKNWTLIFTRADLPDEAPLKDRTGPNGKTQGGYLNSVVNKLRTDDTGADVLRNEIIDLGDLRIGVIAAATVDHGRRVLLQQALMEVTPQLYYTLTMIVPIAPGEPKADPAAQEAATVFKGILDSIEKVDLSQLKREQDESLVRTRGLWAAWKKDKILGALTPDRYLAFRREGKDVGYAYIVEQPADGLPKPGEVHNPMPADKAPGVRVGVRTFTAGENGRSIETESWMYVTFDRQHEAWSNLSVVNDPNAQSVKDRRMNYSEIGASDIEMKRVFDTDERGRTTAHEVPQYTMNVRHADRNLVAEPLSFKLPPFYLPTALGQMMPRLLPLDYSTSYLFATYNGGNRKLMMRYVDVVPEQAVKIDGKTLRGVGVSERIGMSGSITTHYFTRSGEYLGTVNKDTRVEVVPTDRATLLATWKDANLTEPQGSK